MLEKILKNKRLRAKLSGKGDMCAYREYLGWFKAHSEGLDSEMKYLHEKLYALKGDDYQARRIPKIMGYLAPKEGETILECGCGVGAVVQKCLLKKAVVFGVNNNLRELILAKNFMSGESLPGSYFFICADGLRLPFRAGIFDKAVLADVIEHLGDRDKEIIVKEILRVTKSRGYVLVNTPNLLSILLGTIYRKLKAILKGESPAKYGIPFIDGHRGLVSAFYLKRFFKGMRYTFGYYPARFPFFGQRLNTILGTGLGLFREFFSEAFVIDIKKRLQ